ncbi:uncharacterized protein RAG0_09625 [Rhynchosporium agropyri]|uniref:Uncharacterized protein n=1 Tax=Rhynchosporium agropyri TaxID=914238 RepID=A0A1E1KWA6_9HELO|nr:uncharacterized protein RAG0_09625 [Rhynchosporium agropyri]
MNLPCRVKAVESAVGASKNEMVDVLISSQGIPKTAQEKQDEIEMAKKNLKSIYYSNHHTVVDSASKRQSNSTTGAEKAGNERRQSDWWYH